MAPPQGSTRHSPDDIATRIVDAILAGRLAPGQRLGEQSLADLFGVSRTLVREALARLSARGMVEVNSRRGWFVVQPSPEEAREAFEARIAIETGLVQNLAGKPPRETILRLKRHLKAERAAIRAGEAGQRSYLLGDFHVCLAECAGNALLTEILRDLTARTTLIATLFQSTHDASRSCDDHARIVDALEAGDIPLATRLVREHIATVVQHLGTPPPARDALSQLRSALESPRPEPPTPSPRRGLFTDLVPPAPARPPNRAPRRRSLER